MTSSFQMIPASGQSHVGFSHCGGWTGAEGWSVSPGRGGVGSWSTGVVLELELEWVAGVAPGGQGGEV